MSPVSVQWIKGLRLLPLFFQKALLPVPSKVSGGRAFFSCQCIKSCFDNNNIVSYFVSFVNINFQIEYNKSMKNKNLTFMENLKHIRRAKGLSQQELADKCGFTKRVISYYENNATNPPIDKVEIIAKSLDITIADLLNDKLTIKNKTDYEEIDSRILKKILKIKSLPLNEQNSIWHYINTIIEKYELQNKNKELQGSK